VRSYTGFRSEREVYLEYASGESEYYDLTKDPFQLANGAAALSPALTTKFKTRVAALKNCAAAACRAAEGVVGAKPSSP
jgi:hypothetical protein